MNDQELSALIEQLARQKAVIQVQPFDFYLTRDGEVTNQREPRNKGERAIYEAYLENKDDILGKHIAPGWYGTSQEVSALQKEEKSMCAILRPIILAERGDYFLPIKDVDIDFTAENINDRSVVTITYQLYTYTYKCVAINVENGATQLFCVVDGELLRYEIRVGTKIMVAQSAK